jgi:ribokinase
VTSVPRVLSAGHVNWDVTLHVAHLPEPDGEVGIEKRVQSGGGSAANVASALAALGLDSAVFGSVGEDDSGRLARRELESAGVNCEHLLEIPNAETAVKYLVVDSEGEVMVLSGAGANEAFTADDVDRETVASIDHLHLTSQRPETAARLAERAAAGGATVSFDPGRLFARRDYGETLARADVVFVNELEADTLDRPDARLGEDTLVVVTRGAEGATVHGPGGTYTHPGYDIVPLDTTGAGDAFAAGFIAALHGVDPRRPVATVDPAAAGTTVADGGDFERVLAVANACGAAASLRAGARTAPSWQDIEPYLE